MLITQRTRQYALLRAVGADRRLVRRMITMESLVISLFGALLGIVLAWVLAALCPAQRAGRTDVLSAIAG